MPRRHSQRRRLTPKAATQLQDYRLARGRPNRHRLKNSRLPRSPSSSSSSVSSCEVTTCGKAVNDCNTFFQHEKKVEELYKKVQHLQEDLMETPVDCSDAKKIAKIKEFMKLSKLYENEKKRMLSTNSAQRKCYANIAQCGVKSRKSSFSGKRGEALGGVSPTMSPAERREYIRKMRMSSKAYGKIKGGDATTDVNRFIDWLEHL